MLGGHGVYPLPQKGARAGMVETFLFQDGSSLSGLLPSAKGQAPQLWARACLEGQEAEINLQKILRIQ